MLPLCCTFLFFFAFFVSFPSSVKNPSSNLLSSLFPFRCCICPGVCEDTTKYGCVRPDCQGPDCYLKNACPGGDNHRCCVSGITCALGPNGQCTPPDTTTKTTKTTKTTPSPSPPSPGVTTTTTKAGPTTTKKPRTPSPPATAPPPAPLACGGGGKVKVIGPPDDLMFLKAAHIGNFELDTMSIDAHATCKSPFHINEDKVRVGGELTGCPGYKSENKLDLEMKPGKKDERYLYLWLHTITGHGGDGDHNLHEGHYVITWGPPEDSPQSRHDAPYVKNSPHPLRFWLNSRTLMGCVDSPL